MLFVSLCKAKAGSAMRERIARRLQWQWPAGARVIGEYWLQADDPTVVSVVEADDITPMMRAQAEWDDMLEITTIPAVAAEQGLKIAEQLVRAA